MSLRQKSLSPTINKNEIRDAAMRITATNSVKKMREKFENKEFSNKSDNIDDTRLAPKLLIRKFEELSSSTTTPGNHITESAIKKRMATFNTQADNLKRKFDHSSPIIDKQTKFVDDEDDVDHAESIGTTTNCYGDPEETNVLINETARNNGTICGNIDDLDCKDIDRTISNETTLAISANNNKHSTFIKVYSSSLLVLLVSISSHIEYKNPTKNAIYVILRILNSTSRFKVKLCIDIKLLLSLRKTG